MKALVESKLQNEGINRLRMELSQDPERVRQTNLRAILVGVASLTRGMRRYGSGDMIVFPNATN